MRFSDAQAGLGFLSPHTPKVSFRQACKTRFLSLTMGAELLVMSIGRFDAAIDGRQQPQSVSSMPSPYL